MSVFAATTTYDLLQVGRNTGAEKGDLFFVRPSNGLYTGRSALRNG
jgi:hypothetical protein